MNRTLFAIALAFALATSSLSAQVVKGSKSQETKADAKKAADADNAMIAKHRSNGATVTKGTKDTGKKGATVVTNKGADSTHAKSKTVQHEAATTNATH